METGGRCEMSATHVQPRRLIQLRYWLGSERNLDSTTNRPNKPAAPNPATFPPVECSPVRDFPPPEPWHVLCDHFPHESLRSQSLLETRSPTRFRAEPGVP